ncbi:MAG: hypothetical protein HKP12_11815 [Gammaproteobacteria bacterium]|nr:hypothetical protein [Gammaproteobacteria bacterium]
MHFLKGVFLGVVCPQGDGFQALLNPPNDLRLEAGDRIAVLESSSAGSVERVCILSQRKVCHRHRVSGVSE